MFRPATAAVTSVPRRPLEAAVRVAVLDKHPVVRAGVEAILGAAPDLVYVGGAADEHALWPLLERTRADVLLLDLHHPGRHGLALTAALSRFLDGPRVLLHPAIPSERVTVSAALAGAAATVGKAAPADELVRALRVAARPSPRSVAAATRSSSGCPRTTSPARPEPTCSRETDVPA